MAKPTISVLLRIDPELHKRAKDAAWEAKVSLNQWLVALVAAKFSPKAVAQPRAVGIYKGDKPKYAYDTDE